MRQDNWDRQLTIGQYVTFSSFGKYHITISERLTQCHIDFFHRDFEIGTVELVKTFGVCKRCITSRLKSEEQ